MFENQYSALSNFQGIQLECDISVITLNDNINHTYCHKIKWENDNRIPLGSAQLSMPYDEKIEAYWVKYYGPVVIHANLNSHQQSITQAMMSNFPNTTSLNLKGIEEKVEDRKDTHTNKIHLQNDEYNYSYIGKVARFKQVGKTFIVYLEDLGWKFLQKVPKKFRETYIAGQTLDDAFQAICEFMGVDFAYSIEDLSKFNFAADGYSIEKDGQVVEDVVTILSEWGKGNEEEEEEETEDERLANQLEDGQPLEATGMGEFKRREQKKQNASNKKTENTSLNSQVTNTPTATNNEETTEDDTSNVNDKINQYQEEFDNKIKDLFIGNNLYDSNISDPILNYNWITITPKAPVSNATTPTTDTDTTNNTDNTNTNNNETNEATT